MATVVRNTDPSIAGWATKVNAAKAEISTAGVAHLDISEVTVTAADGDGTLAKGLALVNQIAVVYTFHLADALALKAVDATHVIAAAHPVITLATAITLANDIKAKYNLHVADAAAHFNADATNVVAAGDATTTQAQLDTLCNAIKSALNAHMGSTQAPTSVVPSIRVVGA